MTMLRHAAAALGLAALLSPAFPLSPARAAEIKVEAELGQSVLQTGKKGHVYLRLSLKALAARTERRTPVNVALVLDRSGSMQGDRIAAAREAARMALDRLGSDDIVALVAYNHNVDVLQPAARLGASHDSLKRAIDRLRADGTTALYAGVAEGGRQVKASRSDAKVNRVILMSDGLANVGPSTPRELGELGRELGSQGISVTTIGLGLDYNEDLMQRLAGASDGNHAFAEKPADLVRIFNSEFGDALSVYAQDLTIIIECKLGFRPIRVLGRESDIDANRITLKLNQLQAANERYVVVELEQPETGSDSEADVADISVDYLDLDTNARLKAQASTRARFTASEAEAEASMNKGVLAQVTAQIATEMSERAVELRDKGDIAGARKALEENAAYLNKAKERYGIGAAAAPAASVDALSDLERKSREAASNLDADKWDKTRKAMRADQHKSKVQQSY